MECRAIGRDIYSYIAHERIRPKREYWMNSAEMAKSVTIRLSSGVSIENIETLLFPLFHDGFLCSETESKRDYPLYTVATLIHISTARNHTTFGLT